MSTFFMVCLIGVSLSMDAFSLALVYGLQGIGRGDDVRLSLVVGIYHFIMPLIGFGFGNVIFNYFFFDINFLVGIIFFVIGLEMIFSSFKGEEVVGLFNFVGYLLFGLSVSIDSLSVGIGLGAISDNYIGVSFVFMVISGLFTFFGLRFGNRLSVRFGRYATLFGGGVLVLIGVLYFFK